METESSDFCVWEVSCAVDRYGLSMRFQKSSACSKGGKSTGWAGLHDWSLGSDSDSTCRYELSLLLSQQTRRTEKKSFLTWTDVKKISIMKHVCPAQESLLLHQSKCFPFFIMI